MRLLILLSIAAPLCFGGSLVSKFQPIHNGHDFQTLHNTLLDAVNYNVKLEVYLREFQPFTELDAPECGMLQVRDSDTVLSYNYMVSRASYSLTIPAWDFLGVQVFFKNDVEAAVSQLQSTYADDTLAQSMDFADYYRARAIVQTYWSYIRYLRDELPGADKGSDLDFDALLRGMDSVWGLGLAPIEDHETSIAYEYDADEQTLSVTISVDGLLIDDNSISIWIPPHGFNEGDKHGLAGLILLK